MSGSGAGYRHNSFSAYTAFVQFHYQQTDLYDIKKCLYLHYLPISF